MSTGGEGGLPTPRIPGATYRLQFNRGFRFIDAAALVPYLHELGVTDIYASPYLKARKGSLHGYDIVDPSVLNPEVGTEAELQELCAELNRHGMGQILDVVPNHMCCESDNRWWMDVLENGPCSPFAGFFDIDWNPAVWKLSGRLLIPILGDQYGRELEDQTLRLIFEDGAFFILHRDQRFPVLPETYIDILQHRLDRLKEILCEENPRLTEYLSIMTALAHLPPVTEQDGEKVAERYREKEIIKRRLLTLYRDSAEVAQFLEDNIALFNGTPGDPRSFNLLDGLLSRQVWRLSHWRVATEEINYRRFFDINNISAIRMEDPEVFRQTHALVLRLVREGKVSGLRVDHPDGLYEPTDYFRRLQAGCFGALAAPARPEETALPPGRESETAAPTGQYEEALAADPKYRPFYIVGEKILTKGERMPEDWQVFGTTGYDFLNHLNGIFVDQGKARAFDGIYARYIGSKASFADIAYEKKKLVIQVAMSGELNTLGHRLSRISEGNRHTRDFTLNSLIKALTEVIAFFPVYRTYTRAWTVADKDRQYIESAVSKAKRRNPALNASIFDFLADVLLLRFPEDLGEADRVAWLDFVRRFQQMTAPVMAKGLEDTAFYVYGRLVSLNEVGGSPERFGLPLEAFHGQNMERQKLHPHSLTATSTHDTKRSEDVRARINVLSEVPAAWRNFLARWSQLNRRRKTVIEGQLAPDRNEEWLLYQTLLGTWPAGQPGAAETADFRQRVRDYMVKALREAKVNTSWISPNSVYEEAVAKFIDAILADGPDNRFLGEFMSFQRTVAHFGMLNSLSQVLLKIASPGVPDFYQGSEIWDFSLVDPDNRRQMDFGRRRQMLEALKERITVAGADTASLTGELLQRWEDGAIKLYVTATALACRRRLRELFMRGAYLPLSGDGDLKDNLCAFARLEGSDTVIVAVTRFMATVLRLAPEMPLGERVWGASALVLPDELPGNEYLNILTGETVAAVPRGGLRVLPLAQVFATLPVAMLQMKAL